MITLSNSLIEKQSEYGDELTKAIEKELTPLEFKKYSGAMGVYPQKDTDDYMVRPRIYSGILNLDQLKAINELAKEYSKGFLHITTRQSFQFHKVKLEDTWSIIQGLQKIGIITVGAGGNSVRNISCPPLSGVDINEVFDVTPHAKAATEFALNLEGMNTLPRKYKIAFSNNDRDLAKATISDLGFIAKVHQGKRGFRLYGAGGMGNQSAVAILLEEFILEEDILYHVLAMKQLFEDHGDRSNRNKARIRFIAYRLGEDGFKELYQGYVERAKKNNDIDFKLEKYVITERNNTENKEDKEVFLKDNNNVIDDISVLVDGIRIIKQKNDGYYSLYIHPEKGDISSESIDKITGFLESLDYDIDIRLSNTQGMYIRNLKTSDVIALDNITKEHSIHSVFDRSFSCTGAKNCKIGLRDSQGLLEDIYNHLNKYDISEIKRLPEIRISGCRNSCALHQSALLGFEGSSLKTEKGLVSGYKTFVNGTVEEGKTRISESEGFIKVELIPNFIEEILVYLLENDIHDFKQLLISESKYVYNLISEYEEKSK